MGLKENGLVIRDLAIILLTHGHLDHVGLLQRIAEESRAEIYAHPYVVEQYGAYRKGVEENLRFLETTMRCFGVPEDLVARVLAERLIYQALAGPVDIQHPVADGETVAGFIMYHVPGHSTSDVLLYDPRRRIAFTGDHLLKGVTPNPLVRRDPAGPGRAKSLLEYQRSLRRTRDLDIERCYPGHGAPFGEHHKVIDSVLHRHERRTDETRDLIRAEPLTPYALAVRLFSNVDHRALHLVLSVAIGHLDVLESRGEALAEERDGVLYYSLAGSTR
jgi:glyoxylase-like metal-dependent hydrolase (beta-lactamase superfamily II)